MKKETILADFIMGILFMLVAVYWFFEANKMLEVDLGIGPGGYPKFVSTCFFILGFILVVQSLIKGLPKKIEGKINRKELSRLVIFAVVTYVYVLLMKFVGFNLLTPVYLFFGSWYFGYRKYLIAAISSIGLTVGIHFVFRVIFMVMLPEFRLF